MGRIRLAAAWPLVMRFVVMGLVVVGPGSGARADTTAPAAPTTAAPVTAVLPPVPGAVPGSAPGTVFRDCPDCPELVMVPAGQFPMGSLYTDNEADPDEQPPHLVRILAPLAFGRTPVTLAQWDVCVGEGWCQPVADQGWGRGNRPAINVNWDDVHQFLGWLRFRTGHVYRLPSEAEFEYAARGGTTTRYWWGNTAGINNANCQDCGSEWDNRTTAPVASFPPNPFGLYDMLGNVWQWVADCWQDGYRGAPDDGRVRGDDKCDNRVVRGGAWDRKPRSLRAGNRGHLAPAGRTADVGFRVIRDFEP
jgi:formylglycine-generating enzyme required for sulfatase activity